MVVERERLTLEICMVERVSYLFRFDTESSEMEGCLFQVGTRAWMESPYGIKY